MRRLLSALRFNDVQFLSVCVFTLGNLVACASSDAPPWLWIVSWLFWPVMAVVANLILGPPQ